MVFRKSKSGDILPNSKSCYLQHDEIYNVDNELCFFFLVNGIEVPSSFSPYGFLFEDSVHFCFEISGREIRCSNL